MAYRSRLRQLIFRLLVLLDKIVPSRGVPIALYHQVTETPVGYPIGGHVMPGVFRQQMERLAERGYRGVSVGEYLRMRAGDRLPHGKILVLTFDDGQEDVYDHAFPILAELGFSATVFLVSGYIGQEKWLDPVLCTWSDERPHPQALYYRFMDARQIGEMQEAGIEFGSHTRTHPRLTDLPPAGMREEIFGSKRALEAILGRPVDLFCYPFGCFDERVRSVVVEAGYRAACSSVHGVNGAAADLYCLRRYGIAPIAGPAFDVYLTGKYAWYYRCAHWHRRRRGNT